MKTTHTHRGTCQTCGAVQAVDNKRMYLDLPRGQRTEAQTEIYYGPMQLSHWRPKHSAAVLKEFSAAASLVQDIEALVAERARIKAAPGV